MAQTVFIFCAGMAGVFFGMAMLYIFIRITSLLVTTYENRKGTAGE